MACLQKKVQLATFLRLHMEIMKSIIFNLFLLAITLLLRKRSSRKNISYSMGCLERLEKRAIGLRLLVFASDETCLDHCRMNRRAFHKLCEMLKTHGNLKDSRNTSIEEMVASFLYIIGHDQKNRILKHQLGRSCETVSRTFHLVLMAVLRLHSRLLRKPDPVSEDSTDSQWKWFKGCLGALDGTYVKVHVKAVDKPKYQNRHGQVTTNVLAVCTRDMQFIYVLPGWEGFASDARVLRDALSRRTGLKIAQGNYYLCDAGYTNANGFLSPYRGQKYHLNEWRNGYKPRTPKELFNTRHCRARNCVERIFGFIKNKWAILRSKSHYPVTAQCRIILACCLLHNYLRIEMPEEVIPEDNNDVEDLDDMIVSTERSDAWSEWRDNLAQEMWEQWVSSR